MHRGLSGIGEWEWEWERGTGIGMVWDGQFSRSSAKGGHHFWGSLLENPPNFKINERHLDGRWQR